jgi:hypothetical protein
MALKNEKSRPSMGGGGRLGDRRGACGRDARRTPWRLVGHEGKNISSGDLRASDEKRDGISRFVLRLTQQIVDDDP